MKLRGLLVWAGVLAALAVGLWFSNRAEKQKEGKPAPDAAPKIAQIHMDQIKQVDITKGGEVTTLVLGSDSKWQLTSPKPLRADQDTVKTLISSFNPLTSDRLIEEKASDLGGFGLTTPSASFVLTTKDGKKTTLLLGDETPTSGGVFCKLEGDPRIFTVPSYVKSTFDKTWKDLQDRRMIAFDSDKLTRVELTLKGQTVEFGKNNQNEWQIVKPKPMRADAASVDDLVRKLRDAKMDPAVSAEDTTKAAKEFAAGTLVAVARTTDAAGTQQLEVRKSKDNNYYAKGSAAEGIHKATSDLGDGLNKAVTDFRQKKVFDFGWSDPNRVEIKDGTKVRTLVKDKDSKWKEGNKEMDSTSVQALIDKLRDLSATAFHDGGFTAPVLEAAVSSNDGKRNEKVLISQSGAKYLAIRENEPSVYEIDAKVFEELRRVAGDVKEPAPPKKDEKKK
jgi:hypothetical protein